MSQKVEDALNRIKTHKGVQGCMIVNPKGIALKTTMKTDETIEYGSLIAQFTNKAINFIDSLHKGQEVTFIRIRSKKHEIMIAPEKEFSLIVIQNPSNDEM